MADQIDPDDALATELAAPEHRIKAQHQAPAIDGKGGPRRLSAAEMIRSLPDVEQRLLALLLDPATATLPNRELADHLGVTPRTVQQIRASFRFGRAATVSALAYMGHNVPNVIASLVQAASNPDPRNYQDRKLFLQIVGIVEPKPGQGAPADKLIQAATADVMGHETVTKGRAGGLGELVGNALAAAQENAALANRKLRHQGPSEDSAAHIELDSDKAHDAAEAEIAGPGDVVEDEAYTFEEDEEGPSLDDYLKRGEAEDSE